MAGRPAGLHEADPQAWILAQPGGQNRAGGPRTNHQKIEPILPGGRHQNRTNHRREADIVSGFCAGGLSFWRSNLPQSPKRGEAEPP
jgi:hypothetical protein